MPAITLSRKTALTLARADAFPAPAAFDVGGGGPLTFALAPPPPVFRRRRASRFASVAAARPTPSPSSPPATTRAKIELKPASDVLAGAVARAASQGTVHPLDTLKVRLQTGAAGAATGPGPWRRLAGLYAGVGGAASGEGGRVEGGRGKEG